MAEETEGVEDLHRDPEDVDLSWGSLSSIIGAGGDPWADVSPMPSEEEKWAMFVAAAVGVINAAFAAAVQAIVDMVDVMSDVAGTLYTLNTICSAMSDQEKIALFDAIGTFAYLFEKGDKDFSYIKREDPESMISSSFRGENEYKRPFLMGNLVLLRKIGDEIIATISATSSTIDNGPWVSWVIGSVNKVISELARFGNAKEQLEPVKDALIQLSSEQVPIIKFWAAHANLTKVSIELLEVDFLTLTRDFPYGTRSILDLYVNAKETGFSHIRGSIVGYVSRTKAVLDELATALRNLSINGIELPPKP